MSVVEMLSLKGWFPHLRGSAVVDYLTTLRWAVDVWSWWGCRVSYSRVSRWILIHASVFSQTSMSQCACANELLEGFSSCGVLSLQRRGRQSTGGKESSWAAGRSGKSTSATTWTQAASWPPSRCPSIPTVKKPARWASSPGTGLEWVKDLSLCEFRLKMPYMRIDLRFSYLSHLSCCRRWMLWSVRFSCWRICAMSGLCSTTVVFGTLNRRNSPFLWSLCPGCVFCSIFLFEYS